MLKYRLLFGTLMTLLFTGLSFSTVGSMVR